MRHGPEPGSTGKGARRGSPERVLGQSRALAPLQTVVAATTGLIVVLAVLLLAVQALTGPVPGRAGVAAHVVAAVPLLYLLGVPVSLVLNWVLVRAGPGSTVVDTLAYAATWAFLPYLALVPGRPFPSPGTQAVVGLALGAAQYGLVRLTAEDGGRQRAATYAGGAILVGMVVARLAGLW